MLTAALLAIIEWFCCGGLFLSLPPKQRPDMGKHHHGVGTRVTIPMESSDFAESLIPTDHWLMFILKESQCSQLLMGK